MSETSVKKMLLMSVIQTMKNYGEKWAREHAVAYTFGLRNVPDGECELLAEAILDRFEARPSVKEIMELHDEITNPIANESVAEVMAKLREKVSRLGPYAAPDPRFPDSPNIRTLGPPKGYGSWPAEIRTVINAMGGWADFCRNFDFNDAGDRAHFIKLYGGVKQGYSERAISAMRLDYQSQKRLSAPAFEAEDETEAIPSDRPSRRSGPDDLQGVGESIKLLKIGGGKR
jgi:hypothetical protein